jgi:large subunit ribosomal protein L29
MDIQTIRQKTDAELSSILAEQRGLLEDLRFRASARELKNVHEIRQTRRAIARILTVLSERLRRSQAPSAKLQARSTRDSDRLQLAA